VTFHFLRRRFLYSITANTYRTWLFLLVTRWVSYKKQELLTLHEYLSSPPVFGGVRVAHLFSFFLCCPIMCVYVLSCVLWCPLQFPHKNDVWIFFTSSGLYGGFVLFTLFLFVCVLWCPTHIALCFCFVCLRLVYPMLPVSLDCPFLVASSVFSNVYFINIIIYYTAIITIQWETLIYDMWSSFQHCITGSLICPFCTVVIWGITLVYFCRLLW